MSVGKHPGARGSEYGGPEKTPSVKSLLRRPYFEDCAASMHSRRNSSYVKTICSPRWLVSKWPMPVAFE